MEILVKRSGGFVDTNGLDATPEDTAAEHTFYGKGSIFKQSGKIPWKGSPVIELPFEGEYTLPAGVYGGGELGQKIPYFKGIRVDPGSKSIMLGTAGKYAVENIIINALPNLRPENIKKGEFVGGVGPGEWEGYIVTDPKTFYYRGTFAPGQSLSDFSGDEDRYKKPLRTDYKDKIEFSIPDTTLYSYDGLSRFDLPIDLTPLKKLEIEFICNGIHTYPLSFFISLSHIKSNITKEVNANLIYSKRFDIPASENGKASTAVIDISQYSRNAYLYIQLTLVLKGFEFSLLSAKFS